MKKINQLALAFIIILLSASLNAQDYVNAFKLGSSDHDEAFGLYQDSQGNFYISGSFQETVDFDPGAGEALLTVVNKYDGFLAKYDEDWNFLWVIQIGGSEYIYGRHIVVDENGNIYMAGYFNGEADFDPGPDSYLLTGVETDGFVAKYDQDGNFEWAFDLGTDYNCIAYELALDHNGNIWVSGTFKGDMDFDPSTGQFILSDHGFQDAFVAKYNYDGEFVWAGGIGGATSTFHYPELVCDGSGNLYCTGMYTNECDLDPGSGSLLVESAGSSDIMLFKLNASGAFQWGFSMGGIYQDISRDIVYTNGHIVVTGFFEETIDFDPSSGSNIYTNTDDYDAFLAAYTSDGELIWVSAIAGLTANCPVESRAITEDSDHNLYITGGFYGTVDFDPSAASHEITSQGMWDIFTAKFDGNGNFEWANNAGGNDNDFGQNIIIDKDNEAVVVVGKFQGYSEFDNIGPGHILSANGGFDGFMASYTTAAGAYINDGLSELEDVNIYPNPASGEIYINIGAGATDCGFRLINMLGAQVMSGKLHEGSNKVLLDDTGPGIYFLSIESHDHAVVRKVMIRD